MPNGPSHRALPRLYTTKIGGQIVVIVLIGVMNRTTSVAGEMITIVKIVAVDKENPTWICRVGLV
jgi:hypothetical protein